MAYAAFSVVFGEQPSAAKWNILGTNDAGFDTYIGGGTNAIQQVKLTDYTAVAVGSTSIPADDTIPQITEGTEFMTQAITPLSATNLLAIEGNVFYNTQSTSNAIIALFQDSTANALGAWEQYNTTPTAVGIVAFNYTMIAGTTSSTTFRIRGGATSGNFGFNGINTGGIGTRRFGAITKSQIRVTEYKV